MSHEITQEDVAAMATRLYREGLQPANPVASMPVHGHPPMPTQPMSSPGYPAPSAGSMASRATAGGSSSQPVTPFPSSSTVASMAPVAMSPGSMSPGSHPAMPSMNGPGTYATAPSFSHPSRQTATGMNGSQGMGQPSGGGSDDGIRRFVQYVRQGHMTPVHSGQGNPAGLFGGLPGGFLPPFATANPASSHAHPDPGTSRPVSGFPSFHHAFGNRIVGNHGPRPFDINAIRADFPILQQQVHGKPLIWLDNAATTQKPQSVIDAISQYYMNDNSNIHRAAHTLAARSTDAYEQARDKVRDFLGAGSSKEIVFVRGTTEAINLIANTFGSKFLQPGDEILLSVLEHHANIVPWQMIAQQRGAIIRSIPVNDHGEIHMQEYARLLNPKTRIVSLTQASNSLGTILPVTEMTKMAKRFGARVLIDGAQSVAHLPIRVQEMGCDFFVFSGHKIFGPTGIGVAYISEELHEVLPPWQGGGNMIRNVTFEHTEYADAPAKFEAGTPNIADAVGLGAALDYVTRLGLPNIAAYEHGLLEYATEKILRVPGLRLIGTAKEKVGVLSFVLNNRPTEEVGKALDLEGIAVRAGHHCAQPSLRRFGVETTVRPSLSLYNTHAEVDHLVDVLRRMQLG